MEKHEKMMNLRSGRKKSSVGIICCFTGTTQHHRRASFDAASYSSGHLSHPSPRRSPGWFKSKTNDLPEIKGKCRSFISRIAHHRRHASADFSYDPLSYSLNFNDDASSADDESRAMSFSARFPMVSSPRRTHQHLDHNFPRSPLHRSPEVAGERWKLDEATPKKESNLRRGFESLSESMKTLKESPLRPKKSGVSSPSLEAAEEVTKPVGISSNRGILVQLC